MPSNNCNCRSANEAFLSVEQVRIMRGMSPTIDLERTDEGVVITVHDAEGEKTATVYDGSSGKNIDYNDIQNKPTIEGVPLTGNITLADLGLSEMSNEFIDEIIDGGNIHG